MKNKIIIKNISKVYTGKNGSIEAIKDISFDINKGEIIGIVGPSGCGKSTLLNIIAGLDLPSSGKIIWNKDDPNISYMFQGDTMLYWRNVLDNSLLGFELKHKKTKENIDKVIDLLNKYGLGNFIYKNPKELSGGMKQRVSLVRAISTNPDLLLLDEPFSALDYYTRLSISSDVSKMLKENDITTILITHDIGEALSLSDKVIVLSNRPSYVKNIYEVDIPKNEDPIKKRTSKEFNRLYECIWRDIDAKI